MRPHNIIDYEEERWNYICLEGAPELDQESTERIMWNTIDMYKKGKTKRKIKNQKFQGDIEVRGRKGLGYFFGTNYFINIESNGGISKLSVILLDKFDPNLN